MNLTLSSLDHTWILDLDGTLVVHNGYKVYGKDMFLEGAKEFLCSIPENDMVIFLTSRKKDYAKITEEFLEENNIRYDYIIYEAPYGERIIVNDEKPSGLKMAQAINVKRNEACKLSLNIDDDL